MNKAATGILERIYDQHGGIERLASPDIKRIEIEFTSHFLPKSIYTDRNVVRKYFSPDKTTLQEFTEEELASKLLDLGLANNADDARGLVPDLLSREFKAPNSGALDSYRGDHSRFSGIRSDNGSVSYSMQSYFRFD